MREFAKLEIVHRWTSKSLALFAKYLYKVKKKTICVNVDDVRDYGRIWLETTEKTNL